ncbi:hypothetical protein GDO81_011330 [Engystomops pustulosus]|uniref:Uncharacterized protein n=1 Tax=Engystomops pustulosus TaxID=76066 RepID=A0AAV7BDK8_ENGPU|nr:hypothetical protein GDO81_011330 [Engystomops pustulosus]
MKSKVVCSWTTHLCFPLVPCCLALIFTVIDIKLIFFGIFVLSINLSFIKCLYCRVLCVFQVTDALCIVRWGKRPSLSHHKWHMFYWTWIVR